jgi:hypothetical protein
MHRLLTGAAHRTDGRLTKQNLWKEARVSRATMNRAHTILAEWDDQIAQRRSLPVSGCSVTASGPARSISVKV